MNSISHFLVKADHFCDYIPFVSSVTNLIDIFQKCVIVPLMDKSQIAASHYYTHLNQKSFSRCFLFIIPIIGNIIVGIFDFSNKKCQHVSSQIPVPVKEPQTSRTYLSIEDVEKIEVEDRCLESWPCQHRCVVVLKDGRTSSGLSSYGIWSLVSKIAVERINPDAQWKGKDVREHFSSYRTPRNGWEVSSAEKVLNFLFSA